MSKVSCQDATFLASPISAFLDSSVLPVASSAVFCVLKHGIGPNVACPTDSLYKLQLMHLGQAEAGGGLRLSGLTKYKRPTQKCGGKE